MKRALITGAADGIGRALAERLLASDWAVCGLDVDRERAEALPFPFEICDLAQRGSIAHALDRLTAGEAFDLVVHNAGINSTGRFEATDVDTQVRVIDVNLRAPMLLTAGLLRHGRIHAGGSVVFVSSLSHQVGYPSAAAYAATKDGLTSYARSLHVALGPQKVNVLTVFPGPVRTEHARRHAPDGSDEKGRMPPEDLARRIERAIDKRRRILVPGAGPKVFALLGRLLPSVTEGAMKRALYDPLT